MWDYPGYLYTYNAGIKPTEAQLGLYPDHPIRLQATVVYTGQKNSKGKAANQVLVDLLEKFPQYDLVSDEGIQKAIEEIGTKLDEVGCNTENELEVT